MSFNLNLQGAKEIGNYIGPGEYSVRIKRFESTKSRNGHSQIRITFYHKEEGEFIHHANADLTNEFARNWLYTFLKTIGIQGNNGQFNFTERDVVNKPINIKLVREFNDYTEKWNTVLKRFWVFNPNEIVFEKYPIKEEEKNSPQSSNKAQSQTDNTFYNSNIPNDFDETDLPFD